VSCVKVCEESAKEVAEGSDASRTYVARVGLNGSLLLGSEASELETARVILKTRQTRYVDGQSSK
jgi:hypothetical protein